MQQPVKQYCPVGQLGKQLTPQGCIVEGQIGKGQTLGAPPAPEEVPPLPLLVPPLPEPVPPLPEPVPAVPEPPLPEEPPPAPGAPPVAGGGVQSAGKVSLPTQSSQ